MNPVARTRGPAAAARRERIVGMFKNRVPVSEIASTMGVQNPAIYSALRRAGVLPPLKSRTPHTVRYTPSGGRKSARAMMAAPRVARDPCPRCGTRGDIGCAHSGLLIPTGPTPCGLTEFGGIES